MSDSSNPYGGFSGQQMTGQATFGVAPAAGPAPSGNHVKDTTTAGFAKDVVEDSRNQPVLVDFWAPWCGPCKQLTPVLEKVVNEAGGRVKLVKLNIDDHPSIPGQLGIQSIPAIVAFVDGRPADGFMGALPESQVREFIEKLGGTGADDAGAQLEAAIEEAKQLFDQGDIQQAAQLYGAVMQADPTSAKAVAGLAQCMIAVGQEEHARELLDSVPDELKADHDIQMAIKQLNQIDEVKKLGDPAALEKAIAADPDDHAARLKLSKILNVQGKRDEAAEHLLTIMKRDRTFEDDLARRELLELFDVWGPKDPATIAARRRLSALLFS
ncbi:thioredoxin [Agrobacterium sp. ES01]|uniref:thioredoxin n=1 Tax=Agrobacterium sp. ES01 TaxID=3420714 RepID=UPI003D0A3EB2